MVKAKKPKKRPSPKRKKRVVAKKKPVGVEAKEVLIPLTVPAAEAVDRIRVLVAKPGLDGHDRGAKIVARALRDAGMEVFYTGLHQTPEMIVRSAIQEDVQCIGLSILSGAHMTLFPAVMELLKREGAHDILVFGGGIIPKDDITALEQLGVGKLFLPGSSMREIVEWVRENAPRRS